MGFPNPSDSGEIFYGASGDVREEINAHAAVTTSGHYADELELPGSLIIRSLRRSTRLINSYLEPIYPDQIPILATADVPRLLDEISTDIATFYTLRSLVAKLGPLSDEKRRDYFEDHVAEPNGTLPRIRDLKLQLPELTIVTAEEVKSSRNRTPIFDVDKDTNFEVNPDLLDDIADDRNK